MEVVVGFYSASGYTVMIVGLIVLTASVTRTLTRTTPQTGRTVAALALGTTLALIGGWWLEAPTSSVITLAPGEEFVGSSKLGSDGARAIIRLPDGQYSVRDVVLPKDKELEILRSTPIDK
jgi:hypothetical protein